jgi:hypothetical protein
MAKSWTHGDDGLPLSKEECTRRLGEELRRVIALDRLKRQGEGNDYEANLAFCGYSC